jgi:hypothetical protein
MTELTSFVLSFTLPFEDKRGNTICIGTARWLGTCVSVAHSFEGIRCPANINTAIDDGSGGLLLDNK